MMRKENDLVEELLEEVAEQMDDEELDERAKYPYVIVLDKSIESDGSIIDHFTLPFLSLLQDDECEEIKIYINSTGGSVLDAFYLCNMIEQTTKPTYITILGYACSMAELVAISGKNNPLVVRRCYPYSIGMIHAGEWMIHEKVRDFKDVMKMNEAIEEKVRKHILKNSNMDESKVEEIYNKESYFTAQELFDLGLVDEIIGETDHIEIVEDCYDADNMIYVDEDGNQIEQAEGE